MLTSLYALVSHGKDKDGAVFEIRNRKECILRVGGINDPTAQGDPNADWETMLNINFGYYF